MAKNNKGFSLVEVVVAVAVFAILVIPLTTQLISSYKINTTSTKKQYSIEKANEIMETLKTADLNLDEASPTIYIPNGETNGTYEFVLDSSASKTYYKDLDGDGNQETAYNVYKYTCSDIAIGTGYQDYESTIFINDLAYVALSNGYIWTTDDVDDETGEVTEGSAVESDTTAVGDVRNLDNAQVAIIAGASYMGSDSGTTMNTLDNYAYEYFLEKKVSLLSTHEYYYAQYQTGNVNYFANDTMTKATYITVSESNGTYTVECKVVYTATTNLNIIKSEFTSNSSNVLTQTVYSQTYDQLVPVYLIYLPIMYDETYIVDTAEEIYIDTSKIKSTDEAKIYIFETAANVSNISESDAAIICDALNVSSISDLAFSSSLQANVTQFDVQTDVYLNSNDTTSKVYTNVDLSVAQMKACKDAVYYPDLDEILSISDDTSSETYLYDLMVIIKQTGSNSTNTTKITGTRGK